MNTNDFYKELFEKYALDEEKIRRNALKAARTPAWQRTLGTHWKSVAGAAAAVAVTVAGVAYMSQTSGNGGIDIVSSEDMLSAAQRLAAAEQAYNNMPVEETALSNIYVTFTEKVCYSDMVVSLSALADSDSIEIERLYLDDGSVLTGRTEIGNFAETQGSEKCIAGVKLCAPTKCYRDIQDLSRVELAEYESDVLNDDTFAPIVREDKDPLSMDSYTITTAATVTTAPFGFETPASSDTTPGTTAEAVSDSITEIEDTEEPDADTTSVPEIDDTEPDGSVTELDDPDDGMTSPPETDVPITSETSETTADTTAEITVSSEEFTETPELGLITNIYQLNAPNALETLLIDDNAIVLCRDQVYFFKLGGIMTTSQARIVNIGSPKVAYSDDRYVVVSGCGTDGRRNVLVILDMKTGILYGNNNGTDLGNAEIGRVYYSSSDNRFFVSTVADSATYFYEVTIDNSTGLVFRSLVEFAGPVSAAGYKNGLLWFAGSEDNINYSLYSFDCVNGSLNRYAYIGMSCKVRRSITFESFLLTASDAEENTVSYVFDINTANLITVEVAGETQIAETNGTVYLNYGGRTYSVAQNGILTEAPSSAAAFTRRTESPYSVISQDSEKIEVAETNPGWL